MSQACASSLASIVVVTWNAPGHVRSCVQSVLDLTDVPFELIFVDNGSQAETREYLTQMCRTHDNVRLVLNDTNLGYPVAANQGLAIARGKHVVLLNSDTIVTSGWLGRMLTRFEHPQVGLVGPMTNFACNDQQIDDAPFWDANSMQSYAVRWSALMKGQTVHTPLLIGFCLAIRRDLIEKIGGLDERFFPAHFDDHDYCLRAWAAGWKCAVARDVFVYHHGHAVMKANGVRYEDPLELNWTRFKQKWGLPEDHPLGSFYIPERPTFTPGRDYHPLPVEVTEWQTTERMPA